MSTKLISVAIGSKEASVQAIDAIKNGAKTGSWVMLKNVHLDTVDWLSRLEK